MNASCRFDKKNDRIYNKKKTKMASLANPARFEQGCRSWEEKKNFKPTRELILAQNKLNKLRLLSTFERNPDREKEGRKSLRNNVNLVYSLEVKRPKLLNSTKYRKSETYKMRQFRLNETTPIFARVWEIVLWNWFRQPIHYTTAARTKRSSHDDRPLMIFFC